MAIKRKASPAEDLIDLVALMPWWAGVALAATAYAVLHPVATQPLPVSTGAAAAGQLASAAIWRGLATVGQYALPVLCLAGALVSVVRRRSRHALYRAAQLTGAAAVRDMSWQEFELLVGEAFRRRGYAVREIGGGGADGGVDLVLRRGADTFLVQCKQWKALKVGVRTVRELYGVMAAEGAAGGMIVTSGAFTQDAQRFATGRKMELIDGPALLQLLQEAGPRSTARPEASARTAEQAVLDPQATGDALPHRPHVAAPETLPLSASDDSPQGTALACPRCASPMVLRVARRGASAGQSFWGCSAFREGCRGVRPI